MSAELSVGGADPATYLLIDREVARVEPLLRKLAADLHADPETGFEEHRSVRRIAELLRAEGHAVRTGTFDLPTSFVAARGSGRPHFALLAEYDSLPGLGHACGHNVIAAISVGAYLAAAPVVERLGGRLSLIGTPAEEGGGGKELIRRRGGFADVDAAMLVHPEDNDTIYSATSGLREVRVTYRGRPAHAAGSPHKGINALDAIVTAYQSLAQLRQHIMRTQSVHGIITKGGDTANVVPSLTEGRFLVRAADLAALAELSARVEAIFQAAATATGCEVALDWTERIPYLPLNVNETLGDRYGAHLERLGYAIPPQPEALRSTPPSSDVGNISYEVATVQPTIAIAPPGVANHTAEFAEYSVGDMARHAVTVAAVALAGTVADFLASPGLRAAVGAELATASSVPDLAGLGETAPHDSGDPHA